jgi:hypothetical protein
VEWHTGYLGDTDWDRTWVPEDYSFGDEDEASDEDDNDDDEGTDEDEEEYDNLDFSVFDDGCQPPHPQPPSSPVPAGGCDVSGHVNDDGTFVCDDMEDFVGNVAYNILLAKYNGEHYVLPPELMEDKELQVAVLVSAEEEKRAFPGLEDALFLSVVPPPPPPPPRRQPLPSPPHAPPRPGHAEVAEAWDPWPEADARRSASYLRCHPRHQDLPLHPWRIGRGHRRPSLTSPSMKTMTTAFRRPTAALVQP